jgi:hypothetical protein
MAIGEFVRNFTQFSDGMYVHLALRAGTDCPHFIAAFGDMVQNAGARPVMPVPIPVVLFQ